MKGFIILLAASGICVSAAHAETVTLTKDDVVRAGDIQMAIYTATNFGTTPGKVIFDGSKGEFVSAGANLDITIPVSNLALVGTRGATIASCSIGLAFGGAQIRNILVEGLRFDCRSSGTLNAAFVSEGARDVTVRDNVFDIEGTGALINGGSGWKVYNNVITATTFDAEPTHAIEFEEVRDSEIVGNLLNAPFGIRLDSKTSMPSTSNRIVANRIVAAARGMSLEHATRNTVLLNSITLTSDSDSVAILLTGLSSRNRVQLNKATTTTGGSLSTVVDEGTDNKVSGNRP